MRNRVRKLSSRLELIMLAHATRSFAEFVRQAWHLVEQTKPLRWNWHFDVLCEYLEALAADKDMTRLIINMPPSFSIPASNSQLPNQLARFKLVEPTRAQCPSATPVFA